MGCFIGDCLTVNLYNMKNIALLLILFVAFCSCSAQNCTELPTKFSSYEEAASKISKASFKVSESVNTSKSSWIRSAKYRSCDGLTGFLLIGTDDREYIHKGVPISIWNSFRKATSFGSYYNEYIKKRYRLIPE